MLVFKQKLYSTLRHISPKNAVIHFGNSDNLLHSMTFRLLSGYMYYTVGVPDISKLWREIRVLAKGSIHILKISWKGFRMTFQSHWNPSDFPLSIIKRKELSEYNWKLSLIHI